MVYGPATNHREERDVKPKDLRDEFVMAAITGLLSSGNSVLTARQIAVYSGIVADQAMEEREKTNDPD